MKQTIVILLSGLTAAAIIIYLFTNVFISDETRVLRTIERGRQAVIDGSILTLSGLLTPTYQDSSGMDRSMVLAALRRFFQETANRQVNVHDISVQISGERADVHIEFTLRTGEKNTASLQSSSLNAVSYSIRAVLIKEDGNWLIDRTVHEEKQIKI